MTTYAYISNMNSVTDTIEGIIFNAGIFITYTSDQYTLNKYVPTRLDRFVDGVKSHYDLITTNPVLNQEKFDTAANLGLTLAQAAQLPALVSGALNSTVFSLNPNYLSVMASPPTVATSTTNPMPTGRFYGTATANGRMDGAGNPAMSLFRGRYWAKPGTSYPGYLYVAAYTFTYDTVAPTYNNNHIRLSFIHTGTRFTVFLSGSGAALCIKVDGVMVSYTPTTVPSDGNLWYMTVTFAAAATRRIDIDGSSFRLGGVYTDPGDRIKAAPKRGKTMVVPADSFGEGTGNEVAGLYSWIWHMAEALGWDDVIPSAVGGTGITAGNSPRTNFAGRAARDIAAINPDILLIPPSVNDSAQTGTQIVAAVDNLRAVLAAAGWSKKVAIVSPGTGCGMGWFGSLPAQQGVALKAYCAAQSINYLDTNHQTSASTVTLVHTTALTAIAAQSATSLTLSEPLIPGSQYIFADGTTVFATGSSSIDQLATAQVSGATLTQCGPAWITGYGLRAIFTAALASATSATLTGIWGRGSGSWRMRFSDGSEQTGTFTSAGTAVTWPIPVTGAAWAAVYPVGGLLGSSSYSVSSDGTHPSDYGHTGLGYAVAVELVSAALPLY